MSLDAFFLWAASAINRLSRHITCSSREVMVPKSPISAWMMADPNRMHLSGAALPAP
jgi:hypothetical protein